MQPRHIRFLVGWSVKTSEKDSSASIDSIGANLFRHNMISCINVCTYYIECISRNVIKPAFQGVVGAVVEETIPEKCRFGQVVSKHNNAFAIIVY